MLDDRKASILRAVVQEYIETAQPVGSGRVSAAPGVDVSSATVRNEMAVLENEGYLAQPHTSAGRIPTEKGYRYFVDTIGSPGALRGEQAKQVKAFFARAHGELEEMFESTSRLLSGLTAWTGVVVPPSAADVAIRSVQVVGLAPSTALVVTVLADAMVEKHSVELPADVGDDVVARASLHLAAQLTGTMRGAVPADVATTGDPDTDGVVGAVVEVLRRTTPADTADEVFVGGASRVASAFDAVETVQQVLSVLEEQLVVVTLLRDVVDRGLQVAIGTETGMETLADAALVVAPYTVDGERAGSIGVLGPARMNYPEAMAAVAAVSRRLGHHLTEG
ncbi:heat-inducible transcriptional repressor HrcA [Acidimicrobiia bacterium EGI L10123]|uniref:heat-inducible transcriptional repressor HrcA n=1 Tax=Salinilacustrithrix flava TaxID=2957203 RepID=UPI003D7C1CFA|nr:heat-inducible transcriptional repressor HrcA [Acidimicrobiia bacterium EGI L10123]